VLWIVDSRGAYGRHRSPRSTTGPVGGGPQDRIVGHAARNVTVIRVGLHP